MYKHAIIIHMSYISNKRLALHILFEDSSTVKDINNNLTKEFEHLRFGFHVIQNQSDSIESVIQKDPFFEDIKYYNDYNEFLKVIKLDIKPSYKDIAKVVLSTNSFSPLYIQNVIFESHVQYLKKSGKSLLEDSFEAWKNGPVIPKLYNDLKPYGRKNITKLTDYEKKILHARLLQIPESQGIKNIIDKTSDKNSKLSNTKIYNQGHVKDGPWDLTLKNKGPYCTIPKEYIINYAYSL